MPRNAFHFAAGAVILFKDESGKRFTLMQQRSDLEHEPRSWSIYGGMAEPGETPAECMLREVEEEAGIDLSRNNRVPVFTHEEPCNEFQFHNFAVVVDRMIQPVHSRETLDAKWVPLGDTPETLWDHLPRPLHSGMLSLIGNRTASALVNVIL